MKRNIRNQLTGALCAGVLLATSFGAEAAITPANTTVGNTATVNYKVGTVAQDPIGSSPTGNSSGAGTATNFVVADMLSLSVAKVDTSITSKAPGEDVMLTYTVTNNGNAAQGALLTLFDGTAGNDPFGTSGTNEVAPTSPVIHVDDGDSSYNATNDTATSIHTIPVGGSVNVYVTFTIPANANNKDVSVVGLRAQVAAEGSSYAAGAGTAVVATTGAWDAGTEQFVFAGKDNDATGSGNTDYDGYASSYNSALVTVTSGTGTGGGGTGSMQVTKTVGIVSDPTGSATPHAIPGAVMKYTITVHNGGLSDATDVSVSDSIAAESSYIAYKTGSITATIDGTAETTCTDAGTDSATDKCAFSSNTVTVDNMTVPAGKDAVVTFEVTIVQ